MLYPLTFHPIFKERVWGGRNLARLYGKPIPPGVPIGESWEISDRPGDVSVINNGPLAGKDLHWLMENHGPELLGDAPSLNGRFPLLIKILDAEEKLSLQVHPPAARAAELKGEPKTEMWFVTQARPGAELYVGLKRGITRDRFESDIRTGTVADCFHRVKVKSGDAMFLPSGRVHAIGAGLVLFEIQQNSDTTYRVFDWHRVGLDGKPRELHVAESLASIDFDDFEPALAGGTPVRAGQMEIQRLVEHDLFTVNRYSAGESAPILFRDSRFKIIGVVAGSVRVSDGAHATELTSGQFCLIPAAMENRYVQPQPGAVFLVASYPGSSGL